MYFPELPDWAKRHDPHESEAKKGSAD